MAPICDSPVISRSHHIALVSWSKPTRTTRSGSSCISATPADPASRSHGKSPHFLLVSFVQVRVSVHDLVQRIAKISALVRRLRDFPFRRLARGFSQVVRHFEVTLASRVRSLHVAQKLF